MGFAEDEPAALRQVRELLLDAGDAMSPAASPELEPELPFYDPAELEGIIPEQNSKPLDVRQIIARIVDGSRFREFKSRYATTLVCGFAHIHGYPVGIVANNGILFGESAQKGAHFVQLCGQRRIPLLYMQNITGFMVGKAYENGGIARDGAKMVTATSTASVPRITLMFGASNGAGNYAMCGRSYKPDFLFAWPNSKVQGMGPDQAAGVLSQVKNEQRAKEGLPPLEGAELAEFQRPTREKYEAEGNAYFATARLWDDGLIDPRDTRVILGRCLQLCAQRPKEAMQAAAAQPFGVFRM